MGEQNEPRTSGQVVEGAREVELPWAKITALHPNANDREAASGCATSKVPVRRYTLYHAAVREMIEARQIAEAALTETAALRARVTELERNLKGYKMHLHSAELASGHSPFSSFSIGRTITLIKDRAEAAESLAESRLQKIAGLLDEVKEARAKALEEAALESDAEQVWFEPPGSSEKHIAALVGVHGLEFVCVKAGEATRNAISKRIRALIPAGAKAAE